MNTSAVLSPAAFPVMPAELCISTAAFSIFAAVALPENSLKLISVDVPVHNNASVAPLTPFHRICVVGLLDQALVPP